MTNLMKKRGAGAMTRRGFAFAAMAAGLGACGNGIGQTGGARIDARSDAILRYMYDRYPGTRELAEKSVGILVMPLVTEAGLGLGAGYGRGALRINNSTVDYYSAAKASAGLQIGAQQYSHVLFFMTPEALRQFREGSGWVGGANIAYALSQEGQTLRADTTTALSPVIAVVFAQAGLRAGATLEGMKYTRILG